MAAAALQWFWWAAPRGLDIRHCFEKKTVTRLVQAIRKALRLSNEECEGVEHTLAGIAPLVSDGSVALATLKRFLARPTSGASRLLMAALAESGELDEPRTEALLADLAEIEKTDYAPPPLITGDDLTVAGLSPGPVFKRMLDTAYDAQLEGRVTTRQEAMAVAMAVEDAS
jgi:poly(A) polymerase